MIELVSALLLMAAAQTAPGEAPTGSRLAGRRALVRVALGASGLPKGVSCPPQVIAGNQTSGTLVLTATDDAEEASRQLEN